MIKNIWHIKSANKFLLACFLSFLATLIVLFFSNWHSKSSYRINLSNLNYKFQNSVKASTSEIIHFQEKINQTKHPADSDLSALADLYLSEAKKSGTPSTYDKAEHFALSATKINPNNKTAQLVLIKVMISKHKFHDALLRISDLFGENLTDSTSALRASIFLALGRYQEALGQINYLIKVKPDIGSATLKALVLSYLGQDELAFIYFKRAIQIEDINEELQSVFTRSQFAQFLIKKGMFDQAIDLCNMALKIIPSSPFTEFTKGQAYFAKKEYLMAFNSFKNAFAQSKEPVYLLHMIYASKVLNKENDFKILSDQAMKIYNSEYEMNQYGHAVELANLHYVLGEYHKSLEILLQNRKLRKTLRTEIALAKTYLKLDKSEAARDILEEQIAIGATDVDLFYLILKTLNGNQNESVRKIYKNKIAANNPNFNSDTLMAIP